MATNPLMPWIGSLIARLTPPLVALGLAGCGATWEAMDSDGDGYTIAQGDCDESPDSGAAVYPGAAEVWYDGVDGNCDGLDDNDKDGDGHASVDHGGDDCWDDPDTVPESFLALNGLPQLAAADVYTGAELDAAYDGIDANCAGDSDFDQDGDGFDSSTWAQRDGTFGDDCWDSLDEAQPVVTTCTDDGTGTEIFPGDVNPGAQDLPLDGVDQDCGANPDLIEFDADGDAYVWCEECNDSDASIFPDPVVPETWYNGVDENCDGNDGDQDGDGFVASGYAFPVPDQNGDGVPDQGSGDCWDTPEVRPTEFGVLNGFAQPTAAQVNPGVSADEAYDGIDADCAGDDDFDQDGDTQRTADWRDRDSTFGPDCDDADPLINVGAFDDWYDGVDSDCAGNDDFDQDGDGHRVEGMGGGDDCDDTNDDVNPGIANETCATPYDDDCDGSTNDIDATGCTVYYLDSDRDTFGSLTQQCTCVAVVGSYDATNRTDCVDTTATTYPGAPETAADGVDANCDGSEQCYQDADADSYRTATLSTYTSALGATGICSVTGRAPSTMAATDCVDSNSAIYPTRTEVDADGTDSNCDGSETCYQNADGDAYRTATLSTYTAASLGATGICSTSGRAPSSTLATDCDDASNTDYPGASETVANGDDEDCDGVDSCYTDSDGDNFGTAVVVDGSTLDCVTGTGAAVSTDCDDTSATDYPGASETVADGDDEDCDGVDSCYQDVDNDNFGTATVIDGSSLNCTTGTGAPVATDCDDASNADYPGATEVVANGDDDDCDGVDSCYTDADNDNYGTAVVVDGSSLDCVTGTGAPVATDCDDTSNTDYPGASETVNNGDDEDCDGVDSCYRDADNDNFGTATVVDGSSLDCTTGTGAPVSTDCDDGDSGDYPGATETVANGDDEDCDGVDSCYTDSDNDNHGTAVVVDGSTLNCTTGTGAPVADDCNDAVATIYLGASEVVNDGVDQDCDSVDSCYTDADGDNFGTAVVVDGSTLNCTTGTGAPVTGDCNDAAATIYTGATEVVADGVDQDCDNVDSCYTDADGDNHGTAVVVDGSTLNCTTGTGAPVSDDCNDAVATIYTGATEVVGDGVDQSCDGSETCYDDDDNDGPVDTAGDTRVSVDTDCTDANEATAADHAAHTDCNDAVATIYTGATEVVNDGVDQDCDSVDSCYQDVDNDNYGTATVVDGSTLNCTSGTGAPVATDCDDAASGTNPGAADVPADGINQDCSLGDVCYVDADGDTYGSSSTVSSADLDCGDTGEASNTGDCNDLIATIKPGAVIGAAQVNNGVDDNCTSGDECYADSDLDTFGTTTKMESADLDCADSGESALSTDCRDTGTGAAYTYPGATEVCDNVDNDCDGVTTDEAGIVSFQTTGGSTYSNVSGAFSGTTRVAVSATTDGTYNFCEGTFSIGMTLSSNANVNLRGIGTVTLNGRGAGSIVRVDTLGASVDIRDMTLTNGAGTVASGSSYGGAIFANATGASPTTVTLANVVLNANDADRGGAIALLNASTLSGTNVTLSNNTANRGGALYATATASGTISGLVANGNTAGSGSTAGSGGAIYLTGTAPGTASSLTLTNPRIYDNDAVGGDGGGVYLGGGTLNCTGTVGSATLYGIFRNVADGDGGGVFLSSGSLVNTTCDYGADGGADDNIDGDGNTQDDVDVGTGSGDDLENDVTVSY